MKSLVARILPVAALLLLSSALPALAQDDEEGRYSIGVGGGMVQTAGSSDPYLTGSLRIRLGNRDAADERQGAVYGFVEPELGYWTRDEGGVEATDTLLGVNVGGAVRLRVFEYFLAGGVGYHNLDRSVRSGPNTTNIDDGVVGVNAQFGFDVRVSDAVGIFGVGRVDLVQDDVSGDDQQTKVYLGLRIHL